MEQQEFMKITETRLFRGVAEESVRRCVACAAECCYEKEECIFNSGDLVDRIGIVLSGELHLSSFLKNGDEFLYKKYIAYYMFGADIAGTSKRTSPWTMYSCTKSRVLLFPYEIFITDKAGLPSEDRISILCNIMQFVSDENIKKAYRIDALSLKGARERIVCYLSGQKKKRGKDEFDIPFDREELANYLCINRCVLSHELRKMEKEALLECRKNHFHLFF